MTEIKKKLIENLNLKYNHFFNWLVFKKRLFLMLITFQPKETLYAEIGAYYIRKGAKFQIGQKLKLNTPGSTKIRHRYIENIYFNFKNNAITQKLSDRPIKGYSEKFNE